jgi:hypothetical protein
MITPKDILESMFWLKMKFKREMKPYSIPEDFLFSKNNPRQNKGDKELIVS